MKARHRRGFISARQYELPINGGFALITDSAADGERIAMERRQQERDREESEDLQTALI